MQMLLPSDHRVCEVGGGAVPGYLGVVQQSYSSAVKF